jgi:aldehyde dehydrogenase (NAD+)
MPSLVADLESRSGSLYIDGAWRSSSGDGTYETVDPATERVLRHVVDATPSDVDHAVAAAREAFDHGWWQTMRPSERGRLVAALADALERDEDAFTSVTMAETGLLSNIATTAPSVTLLRQAADLSASFSFEETVCPTTAPGRLMNAVVRRVPVGVCALLPAWNAPLVLTIRKLAPALVAGCTVVIKAPPYAPATLLLLAEAIDRVGLPRGVVNVLTTHSVEVSRALVEHPGVDMVSFTGGFEAGRHIMASAAKSVKRVALELGGKSANLVLEDADPAKVAQTAVGNSCNNAGQVCSMLSRLLVPAHMAAEVADLIVKGYSAQRIGDPRDSATTMGPLVREERREAVSGHVRRALQEGAELVFGGKRPENLERGYFFEPTLFTGVARGSALAMDEVFGPVVAMISYGDIDEAVDIANETAFGLQANVESADLPRAFEIAKRLRAGSVSINGESDFTQAPRGGFGHSGIGREVGHWAMDDYLEYQAITWASR